MSDSLVLMDRGYVSKPHMQAIDAAGGFFLIRGKTNFAPSTSFRFSLAWSLRDLFFPPILAALAVFFRQCHIVRV